MTTNWPKFAMTLDTGISNLFWTLGTVFSLFAKLKIFMERWEVLLRRQSREERKNNTSISATPTGCPFVVADPCQHNRIRTPPRSPVHLMGKEIWAGLETRSWSLEHEHLMIWSTFLIWAVQNRLWTMINRKLTKQSYKNRALLMRESEREVRWWMMEPLRSTETHFQSSRINSIDARDSEAAASAAQAANNTFFDHSASAGGRRRCIQQSEIRLQVDLQPGSRVFSRKGICLCVAW